MDKSKKYKLIGVFTLFILVFFLIFRYNIKDFRKTKKVSENNNKINSSLQRRQPVRQYENFSDAITSELLAKHQLSLNQLKNDKTPSIQSNNKLRYDGLYMGSKKIINKFTQEQNKYIGVFKFNENGLALFVDFIEEELEFKLNIKFLRELKDEFSTVNEYEHFDGVTEFKILPNDTIKMKFFDQNYRNNEIDEDNFHIWYGNIFKDKLILSRDESFYSEDRNCVVVDNVINNIEFVFLNLK